MRDEDRLSPRSKWTVGMIKKIHADYLREIKVDDLEKKYGLIRSQMHIYFKRLGLPLRAPKYEYTIYNGRKYFAPDGCWRATTKPYTTLARDIYEFETQTKIPEGHRVLTIDGDPNNLAYENLMLCKTSSRKDKAVSHYERIGRPLCTPKMPGDNFKFSKTPTCTRCLKHMREYKNVKDGQDE
jgi:hypothetical protein